MLTDSYELISLPTLTCAASSLSLIFESATVFSRFPLHHDDHFLFTKAFIKASAPSIFLWVNTQYIDNRQIDR